MNVLSWALVLLLAILVLAAGAYQLLKFIASRDPQNLDQLQKRTLASSAGSLKLAVADTTDSLGKGLSGHQKLKNVHGLLLLPPEPSAALTLLGVQFPLDIVWLDAEYRVLKIARDVKPGFGTLRVPSPAGSKAVVEVPADKLRRLGAIEPGSTLTLR
ncbi:MAG: DUF192 domain-containing protein [Rothia sp. (in: high G+C Gram-positive bacteria)]|nr:DUF192 domain-containing protein [Rothia sp. (in: high G+C Gram-positive bacteria)]